MPRTIKIAAIQMDANPAPLQERLARAEQLVKEAAAGGAQLAALPELFNSGYQYSDENHRLAETIDGPTATWMKTTAAELGIHLAGSLMLLDEDEVYNALLLYAPDGRYWRYDKNYPWGWERGYFRDSHRITIAHTDLGDIGMMLCWDSAHASLWKRYAGQIDLMLICSCPPDVGNPTYHLPDGKQVSFDDLGPAMASMRDGGVRVFTDTIHQQTAWLGVPTVNTAGCGHIRTPVPNGKAMILGILPMAPWLAQYLSQADEVEMSCDMVECTKVVNAQGEVITALSQEDGESFTLAEVTLADKKPSPQEPQPAPPVPQLLYLLSDTLLTSISIPTYRQGLRKTWGEHMAPVQASTREWAALLAVGVGAGFLLGKLSRRKRR